MADPSSGSVQLGRRRPLETAEASDTTAGEPVRLNLLLSGLYAWFVTVAMPTYGARTEVLPKVSAACALVALIGGLLLASRAPRWGRAVTMGGFVGLSAVTWVLLGPVISPERLEPVRAALGGVGWVIFAFGWGVVREQGAVPENDPRVISSTPLEPKRSLPSGTYVVFAVSLLGAAAPWFLAWLVVRSDHALLAQAAALVCSVAMVAAGTQVAIRRGQQWIRPRPAERLNAASPALAALVILGMLGLVLWAIRGS